MTPPQKRGSGDDTAPTLLRLVSGSPRPVLGAAAATRHGHPGDTASGVPVARHFNILAPAREAVQALLTEVTSTLCPVARRSLCGGLIGPLCSLPTAHVSAHAYMCYSDHAKVFNSDTGGIGHICKRDDCVCTCWCSEPPLLSLSLIHHSSVLSDRSVYHTEYDPRADERGPQRPNKASGLTRALA